MQISRINFPRQLAKNPYFQRKLRHSHDFYMKFTANPAAKADRQMQKSVAARIKVSRELGRTIESPPGHDQPASAQSRCLFNCAKKYRSRKRVPRRSNNNPTYEQRASERGARSNTDRAPAKVTLPRLIYLGAQKNP